MCSIAFADVLNSSDVPGGFINILPGKRIELLPHMASHMDVNALMYAGKYKKQILEIQKTAVDNLKRVVVKDFSDCYSDTHESPYYIEDFLEMKTT